MPYPPQATILNGRFGDPVLQVEFRFLNRRFLFDLGEIASLSRHDANQVSHVFISHMHLDHFYGFDHLLRARLTHHEPLTLYGPEGLIDCVAHRLRGYSWNLKPKLPGKLLITAVELHEGGRGERASFDLAEGFAPSARESLSQPGGLLFEDRYAAVRAVVLDHRLPCLAFRCEAKPDLHIRTERLKGMNLAEGEWLNDFKEKIRQGEPDDTPIQTYHYDRRAHRLVKGPVRALASLREELIEAHPGHKLAYVVDSGHSEENQARILDLIAGVDDLFIEAAFLEEDADLAAERYHLTAGQAGRLAARAGVKRVHPLHLSERYEEREADVLAEVAAAFGTPPEG